MPRLIRGIVPSKNSKNPRKTPKNSKDFFEDLKSVHLIWEQTTPRLQCLNRFFIHNPRTPKNSGKNPKKSKKSEKIRNFLKNSKKIQKIRKNLNNLKNQKKIKKFKKTLKITRNSKKNFIIQKIRKKL